MPFGRLGKNSNRSQHALPKVEASASEASRALRSNAAHSASRSGFSSRESLETAASQQQQGQQGQQQGRVLDAQGQGEPTPPQPPPQHLKPGRASTASSPSQGTAPASFQQQQRPADLAPPASLQHAADNHNLNHNQQHLQPLQTRPPFPSADDDVGLAISSPVQSQNQNQSPAQGHPQQLQHSPSLRQHQAPPYQRSHPPPEPEPKRSTRKLIKNILTGSSSSRDAPQPPLAHDNTAGLARRPSKRASHAPNTYRYSLSQLPQVAADQDAADWQLQQQLQQQQQQQQQAHHLHNQSSPLPGLGEIDEDFHARHLDGPIPGHGLPDPPPPTSIRRVATDINPYQASQQQVIPEFQLQPGSPIDNIDSQQQRAFPGKPPPQGQYRTILPQLHTAHSQSIETSSQVSRDSPVADSLPPSQLHSAQISPAPTSAAPNTLESPLPPLPAQQDETMPPPSGGPPSRRSQDAEKAMRSQDGQMGAPPPYRHGQPGGSQSNPALRGAGQDRPAYDGQDQGRASPPPEREDPEKAFKELLTKYKNVKRLYFENKAQIEQMTHQIEHLQNAVANQRISASRTALDDSEYSTRFNRLNGAIHNMAFNMRKDWRLVPAWLDPSVSRDALKTGKHEMTAVGRAVITRWIYDEIFRRCFHPALDPELSRRLKEIENGIRRGSYTLTSQEEFDALTSKVVSWRMATLEGLAGELSSPAADEARAKFTHDMTDGLLGALVECLSDPPPAGIDGAASMIMELAVGIAANMPLESRDVAIRCPMPGDVFDANFMEVEKGGLPPVEAGEEKREESGEEKGERGEKGSEATRVRLPGFVSLEVSGRQVLIKAPVWTLP